MMAKSKSFQTFEQTFGRSQGMMALAVFYQRSLDEGHIEEHQFMRVSDVARAAIVIGVSAMDRYYTRRFAEQLVPYVKAHGPTRGIAEMLEKAGLDTYQALELFSTARPYRRVRALVDAHLEHQVTQRFDVIDKLFLCFGIKDFCQRVQETTQKTRLLRTVRKLINRRHQIVHEGDVDSRGKLRPLNVQQTCKWMKELGRFVYHSEELLNKVFSARSMP